MRVSSGVYRETIPGFPAERARRRVQETLAALGGVDRLLGSCCWHVIGLEWSVRRWAREKLGGNPAEATGVLVAVATLLELHYSGRRRAA